MTLRPCLDCGTPTTTERCDDCRPAHTKIKRQGKTRRDYKTSARHRGYDTAWDRLSRRARELQAWCTDCGATTDLQADHSEAAWKKRAQKRSLTLSDVEVVCGPCNRARGAQRPTQDPRGATPCLVKGDPVPPESIFASHIVGSLCAADGDVPGRRDCAPSGRVDQKAALVDIELREDVGASIGVNDGRIAENPSCICHGGIVS